MVLDLGIFYCQIVQLMSEPQNARNSSQIYALLQNIIEVLYLHFRSDYYSTIFLMYLQNSMAQDKNFCGIDNE